MSTSQKFMVEQINARLVKGIITGSVVGDDGSFGFKVCAKGGKNLAVWVDCDAEGNGPGWLSIREHETKPTAKPKAKKTPVLKQGKCDECGEKMPAITKSLVHDGHLDSCSLYSGNVVPAPGKGGR